MRYCKFKRLILILIGTLAITLIVATSCTGSTHVSDKFIPPHYLVARDTSAYQLFNFYFNPHTPEGLADATFKGKNIIIRNVTLTEEILKNKTDTHINLGGWIIVEYQNPSELESFKAGEVVDIAGECAGLSEERVAVLVKNCLIYPAGYITPRTDAGEEIPSDFY